MIISAKRLAVFAAVLALSMLLMEVGWMRMGSFFGMLFVSLAGVAMVTLSLRWGGLAWPKPSEAPKPDLSLSPAPTHISWIASAVGLALAGLAWELALKDKQLPALIALVGAALAMRQPLRISEEPTLSLYWLGGLTFAIMLVGAYYRFYMAGEIPAGMLTVDEPRLMVLGQEILEGKRETFRVYGSEGNATFWLEGAAMWLFGESINGYRMCAMVPGFITVGLIIMLGRELVNLRAGLIAGAFAAVCYWPVAFSRQEYLVSSSYVPMLAAPWLMLLGLRKGSVLTLVLSGFWLGINFNVYNPSRLIPVFMLVVWLLLWVNKPHWRTSLKASLIPLFGGLIVGLSPLILWAARDPHFALKSYFGKMDWDLIAGAQMAQTTSLGGKFEVAFGQILPNFPRILTMLTTHGGMRPWFLKLDQPVIDHVTLFFVIVGLAAALVRFRQPGVALLVTWWLLGFTPTLISNPQFHMDERRIMAHMPAAMMMAGLGLYTCLQLLTQSLKRPWADKVVLALSLLFFLWHGRANWKTYFHDIELDLTRQNYSHANFDRMSRAIFRQKAKGPIYALISRKPNEDNWFGSNPMNELEEHLSILGRRIPRLVMAESADYLANGGIFQALRQRPMPEAGKKPYDPVVVLTPFHFYLGPLLEKLGGTKEEDVEVYKSKEGPNYQDVGFARDKNGIATRVYRLRDFDASKLGALEKRHVFSYSAEGLKPPRNEPQPGDLVKMFSFAPEYFAIMDRYQKNPKAWGVSVSSTVRLADPYFWITANRMPGGVGLPMRLKARWILRVPADGLYQIGASSSAAFGMKVDGKETIFRYPKDGAIDRVEGLDGWVGEPLQLKAGDHVIEFEQVMLSAQGQFNQLVRLVWKRPGAEKESIPLEFLYPDEEAAKLP